MKRRGCKRMWTALVMLVVALLGWNVFAVGIYPLPQEAKADTGGATHLMVIKHSDLTETTTNTAQTLTDFAVAAKHGVELVAAELRTAFTDDATNAFSSVTMTVGDGTDADYYLASMELNSYGTEVWLKFGRTLASDFGAIAFATNMSLTTTNIVYSGADTNSLTTQAVVIAASPLTANGVGTTAVGRKVYTSADTIDVVFTPTAAYALSALDNGEVWLYLRVWDASQ